MAKKTTRAETILNGARDRVRIAQESVDQAEGQLGIANATLAAHKFALGQLEKDLAKAPRKVSDPKSIAPVAARRSSRKPEAAPSTVSTEADKVNAGDAKACVICGNEEAYADHHPGAASYHVFRTTLKKKSKDNGIVLPDVPEEFQHGATA